ncbi:MAG: hypothetical protein K2N89_14355 [Lachnospiraceae bacterium]|nr:hypothetical protein [Lachnospiraceae bacterium]
MSINGVGAAGYQTTGYETRKTERSASGENFAQHAAEAAQAAGQATAILHGSDEETGDIAVFSNVCFVNNSSITVYKTQDFDPNNPVYKVKIWDKSGNVTEQMVDVSKVDPKNCSTIEMYAYTADLKESGKGSFEDTVLKAAAAKYEGQEDGSSFSFSTKMDWVDIVKEVMQSLYSYGDMKGYMDWKAFLGLLER